MKTYCNLYPQVWDFENLYLAYRKARRGKRSKPGAAAFEHNQEDELLTLQDELQNHTYQPGAYHSFYIHDPKTRLISAAPFRDRVVHHALVNILEPVWEPKFIYDCYANRVGKGTHRAIDRCQQFALVKARRRGKTGWPDPRSRQPCRAKYRKTLPVLVANWRTSGQGTW